MIKGFFLFPFLISFIFCNEIVIYTNVTSNYTDNTKTNYIKEYLNYNLTYSPFIIEILSSVALQEKLIKPLLVTDYKTSTYLNTYLTQGFKRMMMENDLYNLNNCSDFRVNRLFNITSNTPDTQKFCQILRYDWSEMYTNFTCNNFFCNNQGKCLFSKNSIGFINTFCNCNDEYMGINCKFRKATYENGIDWINLINNWNTYYHNVLKNKTNIFTPTETFNDFLDIIMTTLIFSTNSNLADREFIDIAIGKYYDSLLKAKIELEIFEEVENKIIEFMDFIVDEIYSDLTGLDPLRILALSNENVINKERYNLIKKLNEPNKDMELDPNLDKKLNEFRRLRLRFLKLNRYKSNIIDFKKENKNKKINKKDNLNINYMRNLQKIEIDFNDFKTVPDSRPKRRNVNNDTAIIWIYKPATNKMKNTTMINFAQLKEPFILNQYNSISIQSFVVNIHAINITNPYNKTEITYPKINTVIQMYIPWVNVPLEIYHNDYFKNCKVYSFNKHNWNLAENCVLQTNSSQYGACVSCDSFGTYGVGCLNAKAPLVKNSNFFIKFNYVIFYFYIFSYYNLINI